MEDVRFLMGALWRPLFFIEGLLCGGVQDWYRIVYPCFCHKNKGFEGQKVQEHNLFSSRLGPHTCSGVVAIML